MLRHSCALLAVVAISSALVQGQSAQKPHALDRAMREIMAKHRLPGGQVALASDGRLLLSRGYGYADVERKERVRPESLFRIGSVSKPLTAVAILTLVDRGLLRLDDKAFRILDRLKPPPGPTVDPRFYDITIQDLLQHAGGWDSAVFGDPLSQPWARTPNVRIDPPAPPDAATVIRIMLTQPLNFDPGTRIVYANFGYCVLGRVIERVLEAKTTRPATYEEYVRAAVLEPAGVSAMRIGGTRLSERAQGEVRYYPPPGRPLSASVYPGEPDVPAAYGGFYMKALDAAAGWIGSAQDLVRFAMAVDGQSGRRILTPETLRAMRDTPAPRNPRQGEPRSRGLGWFVFQERNGIGWLHDGALRESSYAVLIRRPGGAIVAAAFNSVPEPMGDFSNYVVARLEEAVRAVETDPPKVAPW